MSQKSFQEKIINGYKYSVHMLPPIESNNWLIDLSKMIGPSVGPLLDKFIGKSFEQILQTDIELEFLSKATQLLFSNLDKETIEKLMRRLSEKTLVDGKKLTDLFDVHFSGKLDEMYEWLLFAMKVQWGNSLRALWKLIGTQSALTESKS